MAIGWQTTKVGGKDMRMYVGVPDRPGPHPVVLVAQHAGGVDAFIQDVVHRLHRSGYVAAAPELFHRQPATGVEAVARTGLLRDDEIIADLEATIAHLKSTLGALGPIGITGFCMGGRVTYLGAGSISGLKAAGVFYGGNIMKALGSGPSPFERSANIECPVLGLFGVEDQNPSPADVAQIDAELTRLGKWHEFHVYQNAGHAFLNFMNAERYRARPARAAWEELVSFLDERLKPA